MSLIQNTTKPILLFISPLILTVYFMGRKLIIFGQSKWPTSKALLFFWDTMPCTSPPKTNAIHLKPTGFLNCLITKILEMQVDQRSKGGL